MSKHHFEDLTSDECVDVFDLCDAVPVNPNPKHYRAELVKPADPYEKFRANIEANERRL